MVGVLTPSAGIVRLDGVDIATQSRAVLGPYVGYLPQHTGLFAGTVAENIAGWRRTRIPSAWSRRPRRRACTI